MINKKFSYYSDWRITTRQKIMDGLVYKYKSGLMFPRVDLHNHMIEDGFNSPRPFKEIVELGLKAAVSRVASRGAVAERLAKQRHPRRRQPVARATTLTLTATNDTKRAHQKP